MDMADHGKTRHLTKDQRAKMSYHCRDLTARQREKLRLATERAQKDKARSKMLKDARP
jgi:hypothetical protein